jgi:hypothetical protein
MEQPEGTSAEVEAGIVDIVDVKSAPHAKHTASRKS